MRRFMYGVHVLLHISVFLFFWAVSDFLYTVHQSVGNVARYSLLTSLVMYIAFSISPLIFINSPYHTPLTPPLRSIGRFILLTIRALQRFLPGLRELPCTYLGYFKRIRFDRAHFLVDQANSRAEKLDHYAIKWLFTEDDFSDDNVDTFLESLPGYMLSPFTDQKHLSQQLSTSYIIERIRNHFLTCATSYWLSEEACITRVSGCVNSLRLIFKTSDSRPSSKNEEQLKMDYIQGLIDGLNSLCKGEDQRVALRASCVRGLAFQGLLSHLTPSDVHITPNRPFPVRLVPLYSFVCDGDNRGSTRQQHVAVLSGGVHNNLSNDEESKRMWETLLHDGPLVNLTLLAQAVLSHEHAHPESLSLCWKTLETLLKEFSIARMKVSEPTLQQFNKVLEEARGYAKVNHRGFRITPLVETLDTVARGRRLSMVFLHHLEYYGRADVVFGKDQLRNSDLMEAFASCLPGYISTISQEECQEFMERVVCDDGLWTSLQVNLWNAVRLEIPIPDKLRIFEACCTVIDTMFFALEDSDKVDWRAPDFGSLAQHFEMFVTNCFQGTFVGRATGFHVGLIKLRFCKAVLTKFHKEVRTEGAVSLRSQWDVASLARVFYTLEVGNDEDVVFWRSFTDGGHIGAEFMIKVREMLDTAIRDGPLLNFCKLGYLTVTAVPFAGSGLESADIKKVQALQKTLLDDDQDLPLNRASAEVWKELSRLKCEVDNVLERSFGEERKMLDGLLQMIRHANVLNPYPPQQLPPSPTDLSAHTPSRDDGTSPHNPPSPQTTVHNRIASVVVNQIDMVALPTSPVHPRLSYIREPSRSSTMPTYLPTRREGSESGITTHAGPRPPTRVLTGPSSTLFEDPDPLIPDVPMGPSQGSPGSSDGGGQAISAIAVARDGNAWII
jgi:hypothetical protein